MFEIRKEKVEIVDDLGNKKVYEVGPLTGKYLEDLYYVMEKFSGTNTKEETLSTEELLKVLGTDASTKLHKLVLETLKLSYPDIDTIQLDTFASQNLFKFVEPMIKVNIPSK